MKPAVIVKDLTKIYSKNSNAHLNYGLRDLLGELLGRKRNIAQLRKDEFYSVKGVNFTLHQGESIALIGRNGCGKTTTLKMISGLIKPDGGSILVEGRVQALISLGTGFNRALSGKENIFNAAAVLGLKRNYIKKIYDSIVDFSEIEEFIDTPVGNYSSGMYARLGFAVAVHLNPSILLIDEILSVGDYAFQNKCYQKMVELKNKGVTIVLVSHSHNRVMQLCEKAIWLDRGQVVEMGNSEKVVKNYLRHLDKEKIVKDGEKATKKIKRPDKHSNYIYGGKIYDEFDKIDNLKFELLSDGVESSYLAMHTSVEIRYSFSIASTVSRLETNIVFYRKMDGFHITKINSTNGNIFEEGDYSFVEVSVSIDDFIFSPGDYVIVLAVFDRHSFLYRNVVFNFNVLTSDKTTFPNSIIDLNCRQQRIDSNVTFN